MTTLKNFKDIEKHINKQIASALENEVAKQARKTMKEKVIETVYDAYSPQSYERTGGLYQDSNIDTKMLDDNTLIVRNTRNEDGRDIASIIEYGDGYSYSGLDETIGERPFHQETLNELRGKGLAKKTLKDGLKRQGLTVK